MEQKYASVWHRFGLDDIFDELSVEVAADAERHGAMIAMLPIAFHMAAQHVALDDEWSKSASGLTSHIENIASSLASTEYWLTVANAVRRAFLEPEPPDDLIRYGNEHEDWVIKSLAFVGATIHPEISVQDAARVHLAVLPAAAKVLQNVVGTYRRIAVPFIEEYWNVAFKREQFRFSAPSDVQNSLSEAALLPTNQRAQAILRTIATSLGVQIHDEAKSWLYGSPHGGHPISS